MTPRSLLFSKSALSLSVTLGCLFLTAAVQEARADDPYFRAGVQSYQKGEYKKAYGYFSAAGKNNPYDADNIYYQAMTLQRLNNNKEAIKLYASLVSNFSYSNAGKLAANALNRLDPEYYNQLTKRTQSPTSGRSSNVTSATGRARSTGGGGEGQSADFASLPSEARIPFTKDGGGLLMIDASLNNRSMKMFFDTGAESCVFGKNHLREAGLAEPKGPSTGLSVGVGSSTSVETWGMPANLKVGNIERKNMEIQVQANMVTKPLLGQSFFRDYQYTIDKTSEDSGTIHFVKKTSVGTATRSASSSGSGRDLYAVPFQRSGRNLVVTVEVEGHSMPMFFDTGASNVAFSADQLKKANIPIPEDAQTGTTAGVAGETTMQTFPIKRIKMGPIEKSNFTISCVSTANMQYPLLGQSFFGDWQYTIDNAASVIRFVRR
ncbi:MAG: retroviral-like aspartic protease family protein [Cyanobacteria bacterium SZAS-4]|nr:retroviral-like aspartic protease family protein [Cyanobacteria bacterium SZAS-4]